MRRHVVKVALLAFVALWALATVPGLLDQLGIDAAARAELPALCLGVAFLGGGLALMGWLISLVRAR